MYSERGNLVNCDIFKKCAYLISARVRITKTLSKYEAYDKGPRLHRMQGFRKGGKGEGGGRERWDGGGGGGGGEIKKCKNMPQQIFNTWKQKYLCSTNGFF